MPVGESKATREADAPILLSVDGPVWTVTLNRPQRLNALNPEAINALQARLQAFQEDDAARVCVLTGAGERGFCTGADLRETLPPEGSFAAAMFAPHAPASANGNYIRGLDLHRLGLSKPVIAALNGHALAGGFELAMACDIRLAAPNATFGLPEVKIGSVPAVGGMLRLLQSIPRSAAMTMILTGEAIGAEEALRLGIVSAVHPGENLLGEALKLAHRIAANAPLAVRAARLAAIEGQDMTAGQAMLLEQLIWGVLRDTEDRIEGRKAFAEKRPPRFRGR